MALSFRKLHSHFVAEVSPAELRSVHDPETLAEIRAGMDQYAILVFHDQPFADDEQMAFAQRLDGELHTKTGSRVLVKSRLGNEAVADISNLDIKTGDVIPPDDRRMVYQLANMLWHSDSSFKPVPSLCSLLSARIVPPEGGATEFCGTRAAYDALPDTMKRRVEHFIAVHDFSWSRDQVRPGFFTAEERAVYPPVRHPVVRTNPANGRRAIFIGAHASHIEGMPIEEGRALLKELLAHVSQPEFVYSHEWKEADLVIWDNRCVLHRATPFDTVRYKRFMQRTTISGDPLEYARAS